MVGKLRQNFQEEKEMNHTLLDVLSVWWIVVVIDLSVCWFFVNLTKHTDKAKD